MTAEPGRALAAAVRRSPDDWHSWLVYADWLHAEGAPTVIVYAHYDVQPVDPLDLWQRAPFDPVIENGRVYARGAYAHKGYRDWLWERVQPLIAERGLAGEIHGRMHDPRGPPVVLADPLGHERRVGDEFVDPGGGAAESEVVEEPGHRSAHELQRSGGQAAGLDHDLMSAADQCFRARRYQGDTILVRLYFLRNADLHRKCVLIGS